MKLNKKGLKRLLDVAFDGDEFYQSNALQIEFEPDDFDGGCFQNGKDHIILTVEEAKRLKENAEIAFYEGIWGDEDTVLMDALTKRIEKAEGK